MHCTMRAASKSRCASHPQPCTARSGRGGFAAAGSSWPTSLLLVLLMAASLLQVSASVVAPVAAITSPPSLPLYQTSIPAKYCPDGGSLEAGLCYQRCKPGWKGLACHCWKGAKAYSRGCGTKPLLCQSMSYRQQQLPPVTSREAFSLVLSADPQLFRVVNDYKDVKTALSYNAQLVRSINRVTELEQWTWEAGGGVVQQPRALVMLGDMTELYRQDELDAFRQFYDPSYPTVDGGEGGTGAAAAAPANGLQVQPVDDDQVRVQLPTWLMFGNHDYVNNVNDCPGQFKGMGRNVCAKVAVDTMRSVLPPDCGDVTWKNFPRQNVTSFDTDSLAYSFDYDNWHFVVLQYSPSYVESSLSVRASMGWLAAELSAATAQQRRIVLLVHSHRELGLALDPTFSRLVSNSNVVAIFYGHVHIKPWGMTGNYPGTNVPMFNCGASWYHVFCYAEFGQDRFRVAAVVHNITTGSSKPQWFGTSVHSLLRQQRSKPVLQQFTMNPNMSLSNGAGGLVGGWVGGSTWIALLAVIAAVAMGKW